MAKEQKVGKRERALLSLNCELRAIAYNSSQGVIYGNYEYDT